jgi:hypothetical protein
MLAQFVEKPLGERGALGAPLGNHQRAVSRRSFHRLNTDVAGFSAASGNRT